MKKHYDANQGDEIKWRAQEAYCSVLSKLREAVEEPQQETMAFIDDMHSQLEDMITTPPPTLPSTSSVSGESLSLSLYSHLSSAARKLPIDVFASLTILSCSLYVRSVVIHPIRNK